MDIRPCPRCRESVPDGASFCRRCGVCVGRNANDRPPGVEQRCGSRWASTLAATATAALGAVLALFAASGSRVAIREGETERHGRSVASERVRDEGGRLAGRREALPRDYTGNAAPGGQAGSLAAGRVPPAPVEPGAAARASPLPIQRGPQILDFAGRRAGRGNKVGIVGRRLKGATKVMFVGQERGRAEAKFGALDEDRLLVVVPDLGARPQPAAIFVITPEGSAGAATTFHYTGR